MNNFSGNDCKNCREFSFNLNNLRLTYFKDNTIIISYFKSVKMKNTVNLMIGYFFQK